MSAMLHAGLERGDMFVLRWLDAPQLSPDGTRVAFLESRLVREQDGLTTRAVVASAIGAGAPSELEVKEPTAVAWSPSGACLAVAGDGLWLCSASGGDLRQLAAGPSARPAWSPDGASLAFESSTDGGLRLRVISLGKTTYPPYVGSPGAWQPRWSADGSRLAYLLEGAVVVAHPDGSDRSLRLPATAGRAVAFAWAPDSRRIAVLARPRDDPADLGNQLWLVDLDDASTQRLAGPAEVSLGDPVRGDDPRGTGAPAICWSASSGRILLESAWHGRGPLVWIDPRGGTGFLLEGEHACLCPSDNGAGELAVVLCGNEGPGEVWVVREDGTNARCVTNVDAATRDRVAPTRHLEFGHDGVIVDAWLTGGPATTPAPLIVNLHGGPYYAVGWRFTYEVQRLAGLGAWVLTLNPRGSRGRGDPFAAAIRGAWGTVDAADVRRVVDAVTARSEVDGTRVAGWGISYGGYVLQTMLLSGSTFRTAVSENAPTDLAALWRDQPDTRTFWELALGGPPGQATSQPRSLVADAGRISTPLLLVHAEDDIVCPITHSESMAEALSAAGARVDVLRLPGEGHLVNLEGRPSSRDRRARVVDRWLEDTLFNRVSARAADPGVHQPMEAGSSQESRQR